MKKEEKNKKRRGKIYLIIGIAVLILVAMWIILRFSVGGNEDSWIQDSAGIWVRHGNPSEIPDYVLEQQNALNCAVGLLDNFGGTPDSQCLGACGNYSVDLVHVPRIATDNLANNQCSDYLKNITSHFIELDNQGNVVRVV